jgi:ATP-dependent Clp protease ATP-binding subunit ClpC
MVSVALEGQADTFRRFSQQGRRILLLAQVEARLLTHHEAGPEHLLLGIVHCADDVAARALGDLGITLESARQRVDEVVSALGDAERTEYPMFTAQAKEALRLSAREADTLGHEHVEPPHLLLAIVHLGGNPAVDVLVRLGIAPDELCQRVIAMIPDLVDHGTPALVGGTT